MVTILRTARQKRSGYECRERAHFDRMALQQREVWWGHNTAAAPARLRRRAELLSRRLADYREPRVLEVGCGTGALTVALLERLPSVDLVAYDISPESIRVATERCAGFPHVRIGVADVLRNPIEQGAFDAVIGNSVLHHIPLKSFLVRAFEALRPHGFLWFSEPNMMNPQVACERTIRPVGRWLQNTEDETAFFRWRLKRELVDCGFEDARVTPYDFLHPALPARMVGIADVFSRALARVPLLKEFAGSLEVYARKPAETTVGFHGKGSTSTGALGPSPVQSLVQSV